MLILDLDETLIHSADRTLGRPCDFRVDDFHVYVRPCLDRFLTAVTTSFELAVWSSASAPYVQAITTRILPDAGSLRFVWSRERCTPRTDPDTVEVYWAKNLDKVKRRGYCLARVLMIDDSPEKLDRHYGNLLHLRPFLGDPGDADLEEVLPFLAWLQRTPNFRTVDKRGWRSFRPPGAS